MNVPEPEAPSVEAAPPPDVSERAATAPRIEPSGSLARLRALPWAGIVEGTLVASLLVVVLAWRALWLEQIEIGGDALKVWEFARQIASGGGIPHQFNHHTARFGLVIPAVIAQWIGGSSAAMYFAAPLAASVALHGAVYLITRKISGIFGGTLAVVLLLLFPDTVRMSSQILPELFGPTYTCLALLTALYYCEAKSRRAQLAWLYATGAFLFLAYGARISFLYYAPGCAFLVWNGSFGHAPPTEKGRLRRRLDQLAQHARWGALVRWGQRMRVGDVALLTLMVVVGLGLESIFYSLWTEETSQLAVINKTHVGSARIAYRSAGDFFRLYTGSGMLWQSALLLGAFSALGLLAVARDRRAIFVVLTVLIYFFLNTFVLRKLNPPIPWMRPLVRYLLAAVPLIAILIGAFVNEAFAVAHARLSRWRPRGGRLLPPFAWSIVVSAALVVYCGTRVRTAWAAQWPRGGIETARRTSEVLSKAFAEGVPIVTASKGAKPLRAAGSVYIDAALMKQGDSLPKYSVYQDSAGRVRYYAKGAASHKSARSKKLVASEVERRYGARQCVVILTQRDRFMTRVDASRPDCAELPWKGRAPRAKRR